MQEQQIINQAQGVLERLLNALPVKDFIVSVSAIKNTVTGAVLFSVNAGIAKSSLSDAASLGSQDEAKIARAEKLEAEARQLRAEAAQ